MKRTIILVLILCLAMSGMTGCAQEQKTDGISVVAVIFPEYDWVRQIVGNESGVQLHLLVDDGVDPQLPANGCGYGHRIGMRSADLRRR